MIKEVIFDFDGVLIDSFDLIRSIWDEQGKGVSVDLFKDHHNSNIFEKPIVSFTEEEAQDFFAKFHAQMENKHLFPITSQLKALSEKYNLHIISSNSEKVIEKFLLATGLEKYFNEICGMETEKSKVKKFNMIFDKLKIEPDECVFITDTLGDLLESQKAGVRTIAVSWGFHGEERLKKGNPDLLIHGFDELCGAVEKIINN